MKIRMKTRRFVLAAIVFLFPMINGCFCTYDVSFRVSGDSTNVEIYYNADGDSGSASRDLTLSTWSKTVELVDFWEEDCQEDDPWTEEDESSTIFCQEEDETFKIYLRAINRDGGPNHIKLEILVDGELEKKVESYNVGNNQTISATYYLDDMKK